METEEEQMRVRRRTVQAVLEQCRAALELIQDAELGRDPTGDADMEKVEEVPEEDDAGDRSNPASPSAADYETYELMIVLLGISLMLSNFGKMSMSTVTMNQNKMTMYLLGKKT